MAFELKLRRADDLRMLGVLDDYTSVQAVPRHNAVGAFTVTVSETTPKVAKLVEGNGLLVRYNGQRVMSGDIQTVDWSQTADDGPGTLKVTGVDDNYLLKTAAVWPDPAQPDSGQTAGTYKVSGKAETVMRQLVNVSIGPGARAARRIADLTLAPDLARGPVVTKQINQFANLLDVLADIGNSVGLGFRIIQVGGGRVFEIYEPDTSGKVTFSFGRGNLTDASYTGTPPTCTCAIVVAGGTSSVRVVKEYTRPDPLVPSLRIEQFVDLTSVDTGSVDLAAQMAQAAEEALTAGARQASLAISPIDIDTCRYGVDYGVGDTVTAVIRAGQAINDVVQEVTLSSASNSGDSIRPVVGTQGAADGKQPLAAVMNTIAAITRRVRAVETRVQK